MDLCPCGSNLSYDACCGPVISGAQQAATAEQLMRSRYSAYARKEINHLRESLHPDHRNDFDEKSTRAWAEGAEWHGIEILNTAGGGPDDEEGTVEFSAAFTEQGNRHVHRERSLFRKKDGQWYFVSGGALPAQQVVRSGPKVGRNEPCPCGSGKKYKKCCSPA
ncbi:MAG: YchJ family protein [Thermodesulfovibrionales bacterium]